MRTLFITIVGLFTLFSCSTTQGVSEKTDIDKVTRLKEIQEIFSITEDKICNPAFMKTPQWAQFKTELSTKEVLMLNDADFITLFNRKRKILSFTHYYLKSNTAKRKRKKRLASFELTKLTNKTMLLNIRRFSANTKKINAILETLRKTKYNNLIIDLRENSGGTLNAAVPLVQYLTTKTVHGGYFISRKWFEENTNPPTNEDLEKFTPLRDQTYGGITKKMNKDVGMSLVIPPSRQSTFKGNLYILTANYTASTCEPLVFGFKNNKIGTIVGEKTRGAMLSAYNVRINKKFTVFMPLADYVTVTNERLDKVGVEPDIKVKSEEALEYVLQNLIKN